MNHNSTLLLTLTLENSLVIESLCYTTLHTPINLSWTSLCWWNPSAMPSVMAHSFSAEKFSLTSSNDSKELCISLSHLTLAQTEKLLFPQNPVWLLQKKIHFKIQNIGIFVSYYFTVISYSMLYQVYYSQRSAILGNLLSSADLTRIVADLLAK